MKRILLPTDFSKNAWNAMHFATELFKHIECEFLVLNVFDVYYSTANLMAPEPGNPAYDVAHNESLKALDASISRLESLNNSRHIFKSYSKNNFLLDAITNLVENNGVDMIVMGTKGATDTKRFGFGSNTLTIMEKVTSCPVLAIPDQATFHGFKEILIPTSYEIAYKLHEITPFIDFVKDFDSTIRILHIREKDRLTDQQTENKRLLEDNLTGLVYTFHSLVNIDPATGINCFSQSRDIDLIAMVSKKHSFFYKLTEKNILKEINHYIKLPILLMHHN